MHLSEYACSTVRSGEIPATPEEIDGLHPWVPSWQLARAGGARKLVNRFTFDDAETADLFLERLMRIADEQDRQPEVRREKGSPSLTVEWGARELGDVHPNDFIMAAKTDAAYTLTLVGNEGDMDAETPLPPLEKAPVYERILSRRKLSRTAGL